MQDKITALPEHVQAAIDHHETAKQAFIDSYDKYKTTLARLDKHRKTAQAAHNEAQQTGQQWRELIRQTDGALTKEITALRRKETEDNDLAEEFDKVVLEVESIALVSEREAYDAWRTHGEAFHNAVETYDAYLLEKATRVLFALPEAKIIARAMNKRADLIIDETKNLYGRDETAEGQKAYRQGANQRVGALLLEMFQKTLAGLPDDDGIDDLHKTLTLMDSSLIDKRKFAPKSPAQKHIERHQAANNAA